MQEFMLCFIPLFVAVDAIGVLPLFLALTADTGVRQQKRIVVQSALTAASVAIVFILLGRPLLRTVGVSVSDFMIAGGTLLFVLSLSDMLSSTTASRRMNPDTVGAVPIGVPLITGPAVLTTCLLLVDRYHMVTTMVAVVANVAFAGAIFWFAAPIRALLGGAGTRIISKIASLVLASIAVMMVRTGVLALYVQVRGGP